MSLIEYSVSGVIAGGGTGISGEPYGVDGGGYFGPAGGSIVGLPFTVTWTATDCECIGGMPPSYLLPNPIADVSLQIGNVTYDFGAGGWYGEFSINSPPNNFQQSAWLDGSQIGTNSNGGPTLGSFEIEDGPDFNTNYSAGIFMDLAPVPGPELGSGLAGGLTGGLTVVIVAVAMLGWRRRRWTLTA